jgi:hypothetical protein
MVSTLSQLQTLKGINLITVVAVGLNSQRYLRLGGIYITSVEITVEIDCCVVKEVACTVTDEVTVEILSKDVQKASA